MPKRRRIVKWTGVVLCVMILGTWGTSLRYAFYYSLSGVGLIGATRGYIVVGRAIPGPSRYLKPAPLSLTPPWPPVLVKGRGVGVAAWLLLAVFVPVTLVLFYRDRKRIPPGHCSTCGYNLTGAEHERCPECGETCEVLGAGT